MREGERERVRESESFLSRDAITPPPTHAQCRARREIKNRHNTKGRHHCSSISRWIHAPGGDPTSRVPFFFVRTINKEVKHSFESVSSARFFSTAAAHVYCEKSASQRQVDTRGRRHGPCRGPVSCVVCGDVCDCTLVVVTIVAAFAFADKKSQAIIRQVSIDIFDLFFLPTGPNVKRRRHAVPARTAEAANACQPQRRRVDAVRLPRERQQRRRQRRRAPSPLSHRVWR